MNTKKIIRLSFIGFLSLSGILFLISNSKGISNKNDIKNLTYNDITYLWPVPQNVEDVEMLLTAETVIGNTTIWPEESFNQVLNIAQNSLQIPNFPSPPKYKQIKLVYNKDSTLLKRKNWKIVGFRIDPSAPSTSDQNVINSFGRIPQIRLIVQPVTMNGNSVVVHDFTAHLPFNYTLNNKPPFKADTIAFMRILNDIVKLKKYLESKSKVSSGGVLQVNQGLANKVPGYANKVEAFLSKHLPEGNLDIGFVAFMGLAPRPEPWIFFDMARAPKFQILNTLNTRNMAGKPIGKPNSNWANGKGVSTAVLYHSGVQLNNPAIKGLPVPLNKDIPNIIANPEYSNVLNTDCISCHSESTRRSYLGLEGVKEYKFTSDNIVKKELLPTGIYNVRNLGWFGNATAKAKPVISMRTANETVDVLEYIKNNYSTPYKK
jgi:hypothetical protein